ncbi:MAG TPA: ABC transporter ATP-binding protein, partial [Clostridia bacterium]
MLEISRVSKSIGNHEILKDITFTARDGSIFGLIGPNGAGKTTLIKMIVGIWRHDDGFIKFDGSHIFDCSRVKEIIGYVPDGSHYYESFKLNEIIKFYQLAYKNFNRKKLEELNSIFQLPLSKKVSALSKGMRTKLSLMLGLSIKPKLLVMDEPTSGLDPIAKSELIDILLDEASQNGTTILMSTHNLSDVEKICDNIAVIDKGRIKYTGTVDDMKKNARKIQAVFPSGMP